MGVLVVEDDEEMAEAVATGLRRARMAVDVCNPSRGWGPIGRVTDRAPVSGFPSSLPSRRPTTPPRRSPPIRRRP